MLRIVYFGMTGPFSAPPLEKLLTAGVEVSAVITPSMAAAADWLPRPLSPPPPPPADVPLVNPHLEPNMLHLAWRQHIPVWQVKRLSNPSTVELLAGLRPDLIVVACFSLIFPPALLQLPRYGCLNLHPALLPAYRGPAPLFWMARNDERQAGVTLHFLDEGVDTGDIVAQATLSWPAGISGAELERRCAEAGAGLLLAAVQRLAQGQAVPRRPQPRTGASYFRWPSEDDLLVPTGWSAQRAFNFVRAVRPDWPLRIVLGQESFFIRVANDYDSNLTLNQPYLFSGDEVWIQFQPGVLKIRL
ncbi:MAG: methionyl-tRNA formyltransferase [Chloroflexota bacterium]